MTVIEGAGPHPVVQSVADGAVTSVSGHEMAALVRGVATALEMAGIAAGDTVALWAPNSPHWVAAGLACHLTRIVLAPLDSALGRDEAAAQAMACGAQLMLLPEEHVAGTTGVACLALDRVAPSSRPLPECAPTADQPLALFRTSGTTGDPKLFHLTLGNIGWNVRAIAESGLVKAGDRVLMPLPMHHVFPWITATLTTLTVGAVLILPQGPTGPHMAEAMRLTRPTILVGVPRLFEAMLAGIRTRLRAQSAVMLHAFETLLWLSLRLARVTGGQAGRVLMAPFRRRIAPELEIMVSGGAHMPPDVEAELRALGWDARSGYGLSETAASVTAPLDRPRPGSCGEAIAGCDIRIDRPDAQGVGEILVKGPVVFSGYLDNPAADAAAFTDDGYFRSGDLGRLDEDGFLFVTGRVKEQIVLSGGDTVSPEDVEARYLAAPVISEIAVLERDGALVAVIVPDVAEIAKKEVSNPRKAVSIAVASVAQGLPSTWRLSGFVLSQAPLPRTRLMKLRRFLLPGLYEDLRASGTSSASTAMRAEDAAWLAASPRAEVWQMLHREFPERPISLDGYVGYDLGLDSFGWMNLSLAIEAATGRRLTGAEIARIMTFRDLLTEVSDNAAAGGQGAAAEAASAADAAHWLAPRTRRERSFGTLLHLVNSVVMRSYFRLAVIGHANLADVLEQPVILCPNHSSILDSLAVAAAAPPRLRRRLRWSGSRARTLDTPLHRAIARPVGILPVDESAPMAAVGMAAAALARGRALVWYPEGWLTPDGKLLPFQAGIGHLVLQSRAPVVPLVIDGAFAAMPRDSGFARPHRLRVIFGAPLAAETLLAGVGEGADPAQHVAAGLRTAMLELAAAYGLNLERKAALA